MGNSGSTQHAGTSPVDHNHHHHPHHLRYATQWTYSMPRDDPSIRHQQQIKVLPELKEEPRLRATNNGNILLNGGSISGRKDSIPVYRSKSTASSHGSFEQQHLSSMPHASQRPTGMPLMMMMQRSHTQLDMKPISRRAPSNSDLKRFGSEPDLAGRSVENDANEPKFSRSGAGGKKKRAPPIPNGPRPHSSIDYDPTRFGWKASPPTPPPPSGPKLTGNTNHKLAPNKDLPKKFRLFKTKAESSKISRPPPVSQLSPHKLPINDLSSRYRSLPPPIGEAPKLPLRNSNKQQRSVDHSEWTMMDEPKIKVLPSIVPKFRREKSFDISLLLHQNDISRKSIAKESVDRASSDAAAPAAVTSYHHSKLAPSFSVGGTSEKPIPPPLPPAAAPAIDFQTELLEATRRRSMILEHTAAISGSENRSPPRKKDGTEKSPTADEFHLGKIENMRRISDTDRLHSGNMDSGTTKTFYFGMADEDGKSLNDAQKEIVEKIHLEEIDKFAENLLKKHSRRSAAIESDAESNSGSSESALSSTDDFDDFRRSKDVDADLKPMDTGDGIQLLVRPTLPRRQFEIPRFSPAAAWKTLASQNENEKYPTANRDGDYHRQLMTGENYTSYMESSDICLDAVGGDGTPVFEEQIQRIYREPISGFLPPDNKSGDSGISGDACLPEIPDIRRTSEQPLGKVGPFLSQWTPQQDLGEESSSDEHDDDAPDDMDDGEGECSKPTAKEKLGKFSSTGNGNGGGHMFSLSLPRESHLASYTSDLQQPKQIFNSLQRLKRTVSGAFGQSAGSHEFAGNSCQLRGDNWLLSRSAPNSIDNCDFTSFQNLLIGDEKQHQTKTNDSGSGTSSRHPHHPHHPRQHHPSIQLQPPPQSLGYFTNLKKHSIYLPSNAIDSSNGGIAIGDSAIIVAPDQDAFDRKYLESFGDDNCDEMPSGLMAVKENLQDPEEELAMLPSRPGHMSPSLATLISNQQQQHHGSSKSRHHRFTFQSTIRQIERRRLAERLSKEAEQKEAQRLSEVEAMRRVEEEFQRKRAREKATIRQQLRLYSMGEDTINQFNSLPSEWHSSSSMQHRAEPDGAVASPAPPSPTSPVFPTKNHFMHSSLSPSAEDYIDTKTPYISKLIKKKSGKFANDIKMTATPSPSTDVLLEFRQSRGDYMEYRNDNRDRDRESMAKYKPKSTKHSEIGCKIPQANLMTATDSGNFSSFDAYRKDFRMHRGQSICSSNSDTFE